MVTHGLHLVYSDDEDEDDGDGDDEDGGDGDDDLMLSHSFLFQHRKG